jgi:hypothetical protein
MVRKRFYCAYAYTNASTRTLCPLQELVATYAFATAYSRGWQPAAREAIFYGPHKGS